jgi:chemotaxis protein methyltransferase CheR
MPNTLTVREPSIPLAGGLTSITDQEFDAIRDILYREAGISLGEAKRALVCSRLAKRLRDLRLKTHGEYLEYLGTRDPNGVERQLMINCLTTNKTDFFREPHHFAFLRDVVFPQVKQRAARGGPRRLRIWSAGCSMGDEPYTIAMTILEHFGSLHGWDIRVLASDINTEVLQTAEQGIYPLERIATLSEDLKRRYFFRGTGNCRGLCQVRPEVRRLVTFRRINFADRSWPIHTRFDVLFCRNVIIYFDAETQRRLLPRFAEHLAEGGHLILGHSENLHWLTQIFSPLGNTIYQRRAGVRVTTVDKEAASPTPRAMGPGPWRGQGLIRHGEVAHRREIIVGEYFASREPTEISTVLGSCVAACLFDPVAGIGGMTHFLLPSHATDPTVSARYGVHAMELLINEIMRVGGDRRRLQAKLFGGANVLHSGNSLLDVGKRNGEFARWFLENERIPVIAERLGGRNPVRVHFFPHSGKALVKIFPNPEKIAECEARYREQAAARIANPKSDNITLF